VSKSRLTASEEKFRTALYRALERLVDPAEQQAIKGKPALLRVLTRAAGRGPKQLRTEQRAQEEEQDRREAADYMRTQMELIKPTKKNGHAS